MRPWLPTFCGKNAKCGTARKTDGSPPIRCGRQTRCSRNTAGSDLVHWNNGYWDMNVEAPMTEAMHPLEEYRHFLQRILALCRQNADHVIFATTTPVLEKGSAFDVAHTGCYISYDNDWVRSYNRTARELMEQENVPVNDLYELMQSSESYYKCPDKLHLTEDGYRLCRNRRRQ